MHSPNVGGSPQPLAIDSGSVSKREHQQHQMHRDRNCAVADPHQKMRIGIAGEQQRLEEHHRHRPHRRRTAEPRQHHLGEQRLHREQQQRADKDRRGVDDQHQPVSRQRTAGPVTADGSGECMKAPAKRFRAERRGTGGAWQRKRVKQAAAYCAADAGRRAIGTSIWPTVRAMQRSGLEIAGRNVRVFATEARQ